MPNRIARPRWGHFLPELAALIVFVLLPFVLGQKTTVGGSITDLFVFAILALGLNVVVGYAGLLHLGIAAFFGIGAYIIGILTVGAYPFQLSFSAAIVLATFGAGLAGLILAAPTIRLRGDYLALVTLGFGEVVNVALKNLDAITGGMKTLNPLPPPAMPAWLSSLLHRPITFQNDYRPFYFLSLAILAGVVLLLRNLENSRLGRAWVAIREDELAATCLGIPATRVKLAAFALSAALAGLAGGMFATKLATTSDPHTYSFNLSITVLCCLILGGLGSIRGVLLGVLLLQGYELILVPQLDQWAHALHWSLTLKQWNLLTFGVVLILMVRFRPEGLLPSRRIQHEYHAPASNIEPKDLP
ncbi:MAG TPA: branched-chain amino acid ABC transporter permease [Pirellulales bacterium]|nr:branched-chain amino acid ABC transporter permease [Pirellulales bacterium]